MDHHAMRYPTATPLRPRVRATIFFVGGPRAGKRTTISPSATAAFLLSTSLFRDCDKRLVVGIVPHVIPNEYPPGTVIQPAGSATGEVGFVINGCVLVRQIHPVTGKPTVLDELSIGDSFGEVGAVMKVPQPVEAYAEERSTVVLLPAGVVNLLLERVPQFREAMQRRIEGGKVVLPLPATFPPAESSALPTAARARVEELVVRMESELVGSDAATALETIRDALSVMPPPPHQWVEAGWLFNRAAGLRIAVGDHEGAAIEAQHALACAGWEDDPRALVRLAQAQAATGDDGARETLVRAFHKGGGDWLRQVAPDLLHLLGPT
jgi:hypothetical protein